MKVKYGVVLAGGKSSRMRKDKALLPFQGYKTLTAFQYQKLQSIFGNVYISAKEDKFGGEFELILDSQKIYSPLIAIKSILQELNAPFFLIGVDMPLVSSEAIKKIVDSFDMKAEVIIAKGKILEPLCGVYTPKLLPKINQLLLEENHKLNYLLKISDTLKVEVDPREFVNLNYFQDYQNLIKKEI